MTGLLALVYDVETTGIPAWNLPSDHPSQPFIVEIAAILRNREGSINKPFHALVKPEGWSIPEEMTRIHGISQERALAEGRPAADVFREFMALWSEADFRIAHNQQFDERMLRIALFRHIGRAEADRWKTGKSRCTADLSEPICKLPPTQRMIEAGRGHQYKKPKLEEAYRIIVGKELAETHSALADVTACCEIYLALWQRRQSENLEAFAQ